MLEARNLECERGGRRLFQGMTFSVGSGETLRVAGPNGSGKTSLLRILCGLLTPSAGEVRWNGARIQSLKEEFARHVLYLGHAPAVKDELTGAENLRVACALVGLSPSAQQARDALARFGVPADKPVRQLSQGQRRRAALARLSVSWQAPLWLLDEPFTALDAAAAELTRALLGEHAQRGGSVVYSTHQDAGLRDSRVLEL
ncbi:MAG TPA: cytochrome c biogenesis heme-transporting ATPase CcmA [Burkholderiales bacterium]|nr:cytochrome c biogenesis heme-transporting ATPase CcmA [Burkholderiales bacterium]